MSATTSHDELMKLLPKRGAHRVNARLHDIGVEVSVSQKVGVDLLVDLAGGVGLDPDGRVGGADVA